MSNGTGNVAAVYNSISEELNRFKGSYDLLPVIDAQLAVSSLMMDKDASEDAQSAQDMQSRSLSLSGPVSSIVDQEGYRTVIVMLSDKYREAQQQIYMLQTENARLRRTAERLEDAASRSVAAVAYLEMGTSADGSSEPRAPALTNSYATAVHEGRETGDLTNVIVGSPLQRTIPFFEEAEAITQRQAHEVQAQTLSVLTQLKDALAVIAAADSSSSPQTSPVSAPLSPAHSPLAPPVAPVSRSTTTPFGSRAQTLLSTRATTMTSPIAGGGLVSRVPGSRVYASLGATATSTGTAAASLRSSAGAGSRGGKTVPRSLQQPKRAASSGTPLRLESSSSMYEAETSALAESAVVAASKQHSRKERLETAVQAVKQLLAAHATNNAASTPATTHPSPLPLPLPRPGTQTHEQAPSRRVLTSGSPLATLDAAIGDIQTLVAARDVNSGKLQGSSWKSVAPVASSAVPAPFSPVSTGMGTGMGTGTGKGAWKAGDSPDRWHPSDAATPLLLATRTKTSIFDSHVPEADTDALLARLQDSIFAVDEFHRSV